MEGRRSMTRLVRDERGMDICCAALEWLEDRSAKPLRRMWEAQV